MRDNLTAGNPLTVAHLKTLIAKETTTNPPAFYLSSVHPFHEVIFSPARPDDESKVIKAEPVRFKIFSTSPAVKTSMSEEQKE